MPMPEDPIEYSKYNHILVLDEPNLAWSNIILHKKSKDCHIFVNPQESLYQLRSLEVDYIYTRKELEEQGHVVISKPFDFSNPSTEFWNSLLKHWGEKTEIDCEENWADILEKQEQGKRVGIMLSFPYVPHTVLTSWENSRLIAHFFLLCQKVIRFFPEIRDVDVHVTLHSDQFYLWNVARTAEVFFLFLFLFCFVLFLFLFFFLLF